MDVLFESIRALCLIKDSGCPFGVHQSSVPEKRTMDVLLEFIRALCQRKDN